MNTLKSPFPRMRLRILACAGVLALTFPAAAAFSQDKPAPESKPTPAKLPAKPDWLEHGAVFSPEGCEFTVAFPEQPYHTQRCDAVEKNKNCVEMTSFTKVFGMDATLTFNVSCNPAAPAMAARYSDDVMRTALIAMAKPANLDSFETGYDTVKGRKMAVLLGTGKTDNGSDDLLYTAQLWVGEKSVFTLEGELRGSYVPEADRLFAEILKTATVRDAPAAGEDKGQKKEKEKEKKKD